MRKSFWGEKKTIKLNIDSSRAFIFDSFDKKLIYLNKNMVEVFDAECVFSLLAHINRKSDDNVMDSNANQK